METTELEVLQKMEELKKHGYFEVDKQYMIDYFEKQEHRPSKKFMSKNFVMARQIEDIVIFYSYEYIRDTGIDKLKSIPSWMD